MGIKPNWRKISNSCMDTKWTIRALGIGYFLLNISLGFAGNIDEGVPCKDPQMVQPLSESVLHFIQQTISHVGPPKEKIPEQVEKFYNKKCPGVNPITGAALKISWPLKHSPVRMSRGYSRRHAGDDFPAKRGTNVYAAQDGMINFVGDSGDGYGTKIIIEGTYGWTTLYAHLSRVNRKIARKGAQVLAGDLIGYVGDTGDSSGYHLHFEIQEKVSLNDDSSSAIEHLVPRDPFCFLEKREDLIHE